MAGRPTDANSLTLFSPTSAGEELLATSKAGGRGSPAPSCTSSGVGRVTAEEEEVLAEFEEEETAVEGAKGEGLAEAEGKEAAAAEAGPREGDEKAELQRLVESIAAAHVVRLVPWLTASRSRVCCSDGRLVEEGVAEVEAAELPVNDPPLVRP